jgi:hypothetical protein
MWSPVISMLSEGPTPRWVATFQVSTDALQLGEPGDAFRATFTDLDQRAICFAAGLSRITGKLSDLAWLQAPVKLTPHNQPIEHMGDTSVMLDHSRAIDDEIAAFGGGELALAPYVLRRPVGKSWCASNLNVEIDGARRATNYGWHFRASRGDYRTVSLPQGIWVLQPFANAHWENHTDYSQTADFVRPSVALTDLRSGQLSQVGLDELNKDATLSRLWSHDGPIREGAQSTGTGSGLSWTAWGAIGIASIGALAAAVKLARS